MNAGEFAHALNRMCGETMCSNCPLCDIDCDITVTEKENLDKIVDIVTKWDEEHPANTKEELPDELIVKLKPFDEAFNWASEHLNTISADGVYGIYRQTYERSLYGKELRVKRSRTSTPRDCAVYRTVECPYFYIPDGFIAEIVGPYETPKEKPQPKVYPKHCIVRLVPYEEALKREKETALPDDTVIPKAPWGIPPEAYEELRSNAVKLEFFHNRDMADGDHIIYTVIGYHAFFIPDIFIAEVLQDLDKEA